MAIHAIPTKNALQSTLSSTLSLAETTSFAIADDWSSYLSDVSATRLIILCIDRVDANGTRTPTKREYISATTVTGGSGTTFTTLVRGLGGSTQQAHTAGAVVEIVVDVNTIKSITDGFLVEHNSDGTHKPTAWVTATDGATVTFNLASGTKQKVTLGGNRTLALSNVSTGHVFILKLIQDGAGSRTVTWFSTISWAGGSAPTLTTTLNKADVFGFIQTGTNTYDGFVIGQNI